MIKQKWITQSHKTLYHKIHYIEILFYIPTYNYIRILCLIMYDSFWCRMYIKYLRTYVKTIVNIIIYLILCNDLLFSFF